MEKIEATVVGYDKNRQIIHVEPITFKTGHKVARIAKNIFNPTPKEGDKVIVYLRDGVIPQIISE